MGFITWEEAKEITESYFSPYKCVVDAKESDYKNQIPFVIYYNHEENADRYGPHMIVGFNKKDRLEFELAAYKEAFMETLKRR